MTGRKLIKESNDILVNTYNGHVFYLRYKGETKSYYSWAKFVEALKEKMIETKPHIKEQLNELIAKESLIEVA